MKKIFYIKKENATEEELEKFRKISGFKNVKFYFKNSIKITEEELEINETTLKNGEERTIVFLDTDVKEGDILVPLNIATALEHHKKEAINNEEIKNLSNSQIMLFCELQYINFQNLYGKFYQEEGGVSPALDAPLDIYISEEKNEVILKATNHNSQEREVLEQEFIYLYDLVHLVSKIVINLQVPYEIF